MVVGFGFSDVNALFYICFMFVLGVICCVWG